MISRETFPCASVERNAGESRVRPFFRCGEASRLAVCVVLGQALLAGTAQAGPSGGQVVGGSGAIDYGDGLTKIEQHSRRLAIDWQSFDLDTNEKVRFLQPDASSIALNRILGSSASTIRGAIEANGHVLLVNPRGILFTETAKIDVGGLVASGLDLDPQDFLRGNDRFSAVEGAAGFVVNRGLIEAARGVALLGNSVANESTGSLISAYLVSMNAASEAVLTFDADNMIGVRVTREVLTNQLGVDDAVLNSGSIEAGTVLLNADTSSELFSNAVNNSGVVRAAKIDTSGGVIRLTGTGSDVINTGELDASGAGRGGEIHLEGDRTLVDGEVLADSSTGAGGKISVLGDKVGLLNNAFVSASGASGGGEVLIGGDYLGGDAGGRNSQVTYFAPDAEIFAKAFENGDGGKVIVWADDTTRFYGSIDANAGRGGGDGGFVETSGKFYVDLQGSVTAAAPRGEVGLWFIDPADIVIADEGTHGIENGGIPELWEPETDVSEATANVNTIVDALNAGTSVEIRTANASGEGLGTITVDSAIAKTGDNEATLTLNADRDIVVNQAISTADAGILNVALNAEGEIRLNADVTTNNGAFTSRSVEFNNTGGDIIAGSGAVSVNIGIGGISNTFTAGVATLGTITTTGAIVVNGSGTGADTLIADGDWVLTGLSSAGAVAGTVGGSVNFADIEVLSGAGATLTGPELAVNWDINGSNNTLALEGGTAVVFSGMDNLVGGGEADTFTISGGSLSSISGGDGDDTFNIAGGSFSVLDGGAGTDNFRISDIASIDGETLTGDGTDTLSGPGESAIWTVDIAQGGQLATDNGSVSFVGMNTLVGGDQIDTFNISAAIGTLAGGGGNDIFTFNTDSNVTTASGDAGGDTFNLEGGSVATASGGDGADIFNINTGGNANQLNGDAGADTFNIAGGSFSVLDGGAGIDDFRISNIVSINGKTLTGDGADTLSGPGENATWTVDIAQGGQLATDNGTVSFTGMNTLVGGDQVDTFNISAAIGALEGGAGNDIFNFQSGSDITTARGDAGDDLFNIAGGSIASLVGGAGVDTFAVSDLTAVDGGSLTGDGVDILSGPNADVDWVVDAERAGSLSDGGSTVDFTGMDRLIGGDQRDTFTVSATIGTLEGGAGNDIFNFQSGSDVTTASGGVGDDLFNIAGGLIASLVGGAGVDTFAVSDLTAVGGGSLTGDGTDILSGPNADVDWVVDTNRAGRLSGGGNTVAFSGMDRLIGGDQQDTFTISAIISTLAGGGGNDIFTFSIGSSVTTASGDAGGDTFNLNGGTVDTVNGDDGTDIFNINTGGNANQLNGDAGADIFNIAGGLFTALDGGAGADDFRISDIASINGRALMGDGADTLSGPDENATWTVNADQGGQLATDNGTVSFTGMNTLVGGNRIDTFTISNAIATLRGGEGADIFNFESGGNVTGVMGEAGSDTFNISGGVINTIDGGADVDNFHVNNLSALSSGNLTGDGTDVLNGPDADATWTVTASRSGQLASGGNTISFTGMNTLAGGNQVDTFIIGSIIGSLSGGAGNDIFNFETGSSVNTAQGGAGNDRFNLTAGAVSDIEGGEGNDTFTLMTTAVGGSIKGQAGTDTLSGPGDWGLSSVDRAAGLSGQVSNRAFTGVERLQGDGLGNATLTGSNENLNWALTGVGSGTLSTTEQNAAAFVFTGMGHLQGGSAIDSFVLTSGSIGSVHGGGGADTFRLGAATFANLDGQAGSDTLYGSAQGAAWVIDSDQSNIVGGGSFANMELIQGGAGADTFNLVSGDTVTLVRGGDGDDHFIMGSARVSVDGESGSNTLTGPNADTLWTLTGNGTGTVANTFINNTFANMAILQGGAGADNFQLNSGRFDAIKGGAGSDRFALGGATVTGLLDGEEGKDTVRGADADADWMVETTGGSVGNISFTRVETLQGGSGVDNFQLNASGGVVDVYGGAGNDAYVFSAAVSGVLLDGQEGADSASGAGDWALSNVSDNNGADGSVANNTFAHMETLVGDNAAGTTLKGADQTLVWSLTSAGTGTLGTPAAGAAPINFSGISNFSGGSGSDTLISTGASRNWTISTTGSSLGENGISGFENIEDRTGALTLTTDYSATFESGSNMRVGGSTLAYFGSPVTVIGADGVNGEVTTSTLTLIDITNDIELTGNVDSIDANILGSGNISIDDSDDIRVNSLITAGGDIEVTAVNDITVNHISTSGVTGSTATVTSTRGIVLARPRPLSPTPAGNVPDVHIEADNVNLNALFGNLGTPISPFVITARNNVTVRGLTFVNPVFTPNQPANYVASGTRLISVAETLSTSAVRSAVQSRIEDFAVVDPAIFTALTPYNIEEGALTLPEDQRLEE